MRRERSGVTALRGQEGWSVLSGECLWLLAEACRGLADPAAWLPHAVRSAPRPFGSPVRSAPRHVHAARARLC